MAHIKCRYRRHGCALIEAPTEPSWDNYDGWCVDNNECSFYSSDKKGLTCKNFRWRSFEFETTVKNYEYCDDYDCWGCYNRQQPGLKIKGQFIEDEQIIYLEIDERVIINRREK